MAQYDPAKRYTWTPEDTFTISGQDFGLFLNTVRSYLSSEEAARFQLMIKTNEVIERIMVSGVEADIIKEVVEEAPIEEVSSKDL
jgi:CO dehydrogenase/acetyl-CoA synthase gamma subunit (corrinoid Fe-S protein)